MKNLKSNYLLAVDWLADNTELVDLYSTKDLGVTLTLWTTRYRNKVYTTKAHGRTLLDARMRAGIKMWVRLRSKGNRNGTNKT